MQYMARRDTGCSLSLHMWETHFARFTCNRATPFWKVKVHMITSACKVEKYVPIGSTPANLGIRTGSTVDLWLTVDGEVALLVQLQQLILNGPSLTVEALHLTPWQHVQLACVQKTMLEYDSMDLQHDANGKLQQALHKLSQCQLSKTRC